MVQTVVLLGSDLCGVAKFFKSGSDTHMTHNALSQPM